MKYPSYLFTGSRASATRCLAACFATSFGLDAAACLIMVFIALIYLAG
jgi:hypothetical protein